MDVRKLWDAGAAKRLGSDAATIVYRSVADLNQVLIANIHKVSGRFDVIAGIPRSGMLAGSLLALHLNLPLITIDDLISGSLQQPHSKRTIRSHQARSPIRILLVDDSINEGTALAKALDSIKRSPASRYDIRSCAIFASSKGKSLVDIYFQVLDHPRIFEWNALHHGYMSDFLIDLDGVLCVDGPPENSNDGGRYAEYIANAVPKILTTTEVGAIVTSRLEKYRSITEEWLTSHKIKYKQLIMLNLATAEDRRSLGIHAKYKADVYAELGGRLFIESEEWQAKTIAALTKKPVLLLDKAVLF